MLTITVTAPSGLSVSSPYAQTIYQHMLTWEEIPAAERAKAVEQLCDALAHERYATAGALAGRHGLAVAFSQPRRIEAEYHVPTDPQDDLNCEACQ